MNLDHLIPQTSEKREHAPSINNPTNSPALINPVRPIRDDDALSFRAVLDSVCRERRYLAQLEAPPLERVRTFISTNVRANHAQFVAEVEGTIVGWCDAIPGETLSGTTHVGRLGMGILQAYRRQGIGRQLVGATLQKAAMNGLLKVELTVHASNLAAIALYRGTGFVEEGRRVRGWFVDGIYDDILLMARHLMPGRDLGPNLAVGTPPSLTHGDDIQS